MSGHRYLANSNNLFEEDDIDDETFLKNSKLNASNTAVSTNPFEKQKLQLQEKRKQIEQSTLESSNRSLSLLYETEEVGKATAIELTKQREQLENSSRQLDEISATLRFSQKHLNGLKSVFGGLKNYLSGDRGMPRTLASSSIPDFPKDTGKTTATNDSSLPTSEFYNQDAPSKIHHDSNYLQKEKQATGKFEHQLDKNLDMMCGSLSRLKGLATDLQQEIETQNDLLDNMNYKIGDVDMKMTKQNKEINKLLGK